MKKIIKLICCMTMLLCLGCSSKSHLDPDNPVTVRLWNYYTGKQMESFNQLVDQFNTSIGKEKGIIVEVTSFGNVNELGQSVLDSANKKVGAKEVPHIFAAYADTAYQVDKLDLVENLKPYFTDKELSEYIDGYIDEGMFNDELKIFPIAKSTELMMINMTDFNKFSKATGAQLSDLSTLEGLTATAKKYYEYTDQLTATPNDGKAFFGRDAMANYIVVGLKQLGHDIIDIKDGKTVLDFDKQSVKKLWDNYYIPYVHGYFKAEGRFRSDDVKLGNIISFVGSSSGATFFPKQVIVSDEKSYPIDVKVLEAPLFQDAQKYAVQQGAGMVVTKSDDAHVEGSVEFLKWFTQKEQNITFSIDSGYLPVTKEANQMKTIQETTKINSELMKEVIEVSVDTVNNKKLYTTKAFDNGAKLRTQLENCLNDKAKEDYENAQKALKSGKSADDVYSQYDSNENFEEWYQTTYQKLKDIIG
ncbi:MAG: extracellular solute-binding protein [Longibaculum sp.]